MDTKTMVICGAALLFAIIDLAFTDDGKLGTYMLYFFIVKAIYDCIFICL